MTDDSCKQLGTVSQGESSHVGASLSGGVQMETFIPWTLVKRGVRRKVITPIDAAEHFQREAAVERSATKLPKDSPLIRALGLAHYWQRLLDDGMYRSSSSHDPRQSANLSKFRSYRRH